jgi:inorganic pyrophosphatase
VLGTTAAEFSRSLKKVFRMASGNTYSQYRPHPWHGLSAGPAPPDRVSAYIEITPFDLMKYEMDKTSGYLKVDRPQRGSSLPPTLYGFVPRTYCAERVAALSPHADCGDEDPLDICVLTERPISRAEVPLTARVIGVLSTLDDEQADDKIIAVLDSDALWSQAQDISDVEEAIVNRLRHYFATYKMSPGEPNRVEIIDLQGRERAAAVVAAAMGDYDRAFARHIASTNGGS